MPNIFYPVFLDVRGRRCVILGGGHEEETKAEVLLERGAQVTVINPGVTVAILDLARAGALLWERRPYRAEDLKGAFLAVAEMGASGDLLQVALENNVLLNVVDTTRLCIWIAAAIVRRGDVTLAISTGGASPALARKLREGLTRSRALQWADLSPLLGRARLELKRRGVRAPGARWQAALSDGLLDLHQRGEQQQAWESLMASLVDGGMPMPPSEVAADAESLEDGLLPTEGESTASHDGPPDNRYYPVYLRLQGRLCVVIGGGEVAERKVGQLLESQAKVKVVSPEVTAGLQRLASEGALAWEARAYRAGDLARAFLAIAATSDSAVNRQVAQEAEDQNVLVNVVDNPGLGRFLAPSVVRRGEVIVAISTGGASPALARKLKEELAQCPELQWAAAAPLLSWARLELRPRGVRVRPDRWQECLTDDLLLLYQGGRYEEAQERLMAMLLERGEPAPDARSP